MLDTRSFKVRLISTGLPVIGKFMRTGMITAGSRTGFPRPKKRKKEEKKILPCKPPAPCLHPTWKSGQTDRMYPSADR